LACQAAAFAQPKAAAAAGDQKPNAAESFVQAYVEAFNKGDAAALAAMWAATCSHLDRGTGARLEGREAIQANLAKVFQEQPGTKLAGHVDNVQAIKADVVSATGRTLLNTPAGEPTESVFTAILIQEGGKWVIASLEEAPVQQPITPREALRDLAWLVGHWVDESESGRVDTTIRWSRNEAFLIRSYSAQDLDGLASEGTQVIGWDPRSQQIRSWTFNSDGSFGDATWSRNGDEWLIKSSQTLADGRAASGTYVTSRIDDNTISVQLIGHEIEGEPTPASDPVTVVRVPEPAPAPENPAPANPAPANR